VKRGEGEKGRELKRLDKLYARSSNESFIFIYILFFLYNFGLRAA